MSEDILRGPHAQIAVGECEECKRLRVELDATEDAARMYAERSSRFAGQADKWESAAVSGLQAVEYWQAEANEARSKRDEAEACLAFERVTVAELRAEIERFRNAVREKERLELAALQELDEARAKVEWLRSEVEHFKGAAKEHAEKQAVADEAHADTQEWLAGARLALVKMEVERAELRRRLDVWENASVAQLVRERDEARAEVERLRRALICSEDDFGHRCIRCDSEVEP